MEIISSRNENIKEIVEVHKSAFPNFFLTELGDDFLNLYYKSVADSSKGILLVSVEDNRVIGFCAACTESSGFNTSLIKENFLKFSVVGVKLLFSRPRSLVRLFKNLSKQENMEDKGDYAELMSIGVSSDIQNKGVGKALLTDLEKALKEKGVTKLSLTTDADENEKTLGFYAKNGFTKWYEFVTYPSRKMYRLIKQL